MKESKFIKQGKLCISNEKIREELIKYRKTNELSDDLTEIILTMIHKLKNYKKYYTNIMDQEDSIHDCFLYVMTKLHTIPIEEYSITGEPIKPFNWLSQLINTQFVQSWRNLHPKNLKTISIDISELYNL